ncbi:MAG TPA: hypothetical protein VLZ33_07025 [Dysgonamonadaceae bacterium]|nr:hypothetical protein [Dysgonamonadaceae bacterium]
MRMKYEYWIVAVALFVFFLLGCTDSQQKMPDHINEYVAAIDFGKLGNTTPQVRYSEISENRIKVSVSFELKDSVYQNDWQVNITPDFSPDFHWASHLTPTEEHVIAQHAFRAPAMIVSSQEKVLSIIPDLGLLQQSNPVKWYMDLDAVNNKITLGMSDSEVREHILYVRKPGAVFPPGKIEFGFYILISSQSEDTLNPFRNVASLLWEKWGEEEFHTLVSGYADLEKYVERTYDWAFNHWKESIWQEFNLNGKKVGAPVFIVNVTQSPNYPGEINEREFRSVWNQAWFSSLRSASGLYRYAKRTENSDLLDKALKTKELALLFPQNKGFFPAVIGTDMERVEINGEKYKRSKGWDTYFFGNSDRNPYTRNAQASPLHLLDMSFTANQMLLWYSELEADQRLLDYALRYANALVLTQTEDGFFPAWLDTESLKPLEHLNKSPETAMSATFLLNLYKITQNRKYLETAINATEALVKNIVFTGQWEDFETYWSCSSYGKDDLVGKKIERNNQFKQNTLSMFWTAEALLQSYHTTGERRYLEIGERTLDELLMYQSAWQPPYIYIRALGGFAVMNADGEWNDSRQSLFAELIIRYGVELNRAEYVQRGLAALYASFEMMYCPENGATKELWEKTWPFFNKEDYGFMMENYGHLGLTSLDGLGIGEFTIYDWGNGAASEAYNRVVDHYGKDFEKLDRFLNER